jgi:glycosyltransferase involved in cell wall biosynthesis
MGEYLDERRYLGGVDLSIFVSEEDSASFRNRHRRFESAWVPNGVDVDFFSRAAGDRAPAGDPVVSFMGNMVHKPNEEAAVYLLKEIAPLIRRAVPEVRFRIIGSQPSERLSRLVGERVEVTGWVEDLRPLVWESAVMLMPMQTGTGIKNKLLEAWASGVAVVATKYAIQGVPARDGENLLVGSTGEELAAKTVRLLRDAEFRGKIGEAGLRTVRENLNWSQVAGRYRQIAVSRLRAKRAEKRSRMDD